MVHIPASWAHQGGDSNGAAHRADPLDRGADRRSVHRRAGQGRRKHPCHDDGHDARYTEKPEGLHEGRRS